MKYFSILIFLVSLLRQNFQNSKLGGPTVYVKLQFRTAKV